MNKPFAHWLAGFTAGEGCFYIHRAKQRKNYIQYRPRFQIKLRVDDTPTIRAIKKAFGFGRGSHISQHGSSKPCRTFEVYKTADLLKIVAFFDQYPLLNKKQDDFLVWREAVLWLANAPRGNKHWGPRDWSQMLAYKKRLQAIRRFKR